MTKQSAKQKALLLFNQTKNRLAKNLASHSLASKRLLSSKRRSGKGKQLSHKQLGKRLRLSRRQLSKQLPVNGKRLHVPVPVKSKRIYGKQVKQQTSNLLKQMKGKQLPASNRLPANNRLAAKCKQLPASNRLPAKGKHLPASNRLPAKGKQLPASNRLPAKGKQLPKKQSDNRLSDKHAAAAGGEPLPSTAQPAESVSTERQAGAAAATPGSYQEIEVKCVDELWYRALLLEYDGGTEECEIYFPDPERDHQVHPDLMIRSVILGTNQLTKHDVGEELMAMYPSGLVSI